MNTNKNNKKSKGTTKSPNATVDYVIKKKNLVYKWIYNGLTIADVANKLGVSRSWLFEVFKNNDELAELKEQAYADRREKLENTIYQMALGNYKTKVRRTTTVSKITKKIDKSGKTLSTEYSDVITESSEDIIEHVDDPNFKAITLLMNREGIKAVQDVPSTIEDTIEEPDKMTFIDVEKDDNIKTEDKLLDK